jgi:chromosomal replication initiator protein
VSEAPGKAYNPLLVYGESGLGKTHLLHAIGHYVRSLYTNARCATSPARSSPTSSSTRFATTAQDRFKRRYRDVDVLLIDDIQFLQGKTQTQESSSTPSTPCTTPTSRSCMTSDQAPKKLEALEERLRNRFEWGLITDVQPPSSRRASRSCARRRRWTG